MTYPPDKANAQEVCRKLLALCTELREELPNDPEGRTLALGVTMFFGVFLSAISKEYRQQACDAAQGFALNTDDRIGSC